MHREGTLERPAEPRQAAVRAPPCLGRDTGVMPVIEAMLIGFLILSAIFFATAFKAPPSPSADAGTNELEAISWDAVRTLNDMHYPDGTYANSTLSKALADAMAEDTANLTASFSPFFPPATVFNVYLNNGYDRMPVYEARQPTGQTIGISFPIEPRWNYVYTSPDLEVYDSAGTTTTMGLTLIPLYYSNLVRDEGVLINVTTEGTQSWVPGRPGSSGTTEYRETSFTTLIHDDAPAPSPSLYLECNKATPAAPDLKPCYAIDLTNSTDKYRAEEPGRLVFVLDNEGSAALTGESTVTIRLPVGLEVSNAASDDFDAVVMRGTAPNPQSVVATLSSPLPAGSQARVRVWVNVTDDRYAFKTIDARLSGSAASTSQLLALVNTLTPGVYTGGDARSVLVSGPRPQDGGATPSGRWAIVMPFPFGDGTIDFIRFKTQDGSALFDTADYPPDFDPHPGVRDVLLNVMPSTGAGHSIEWSNTHSLGSNSFIELQMDVTTLDIPIVASPTLPLAGPRPVFEGYQPAPYAIQHDQGVWWREEPPEKDGLGSDDLPGFGKGFLVGTGVNTTIEGRLAYRNGLPKGTTSYVLADMSETTSSQGALKDALRAARLEPEQPTVAIGNTIDFRLNTVDLSTYLADEVGFGNVNMTTRIYAPWGVRERVPVATVYHEAAGGVLERPNDLEAAYLNGDSVQDVVVSYSDGNVYGTNGDTGRVLSGHTFQIPETGNLANPVEPTFLAKLRSSGGLIDYGVGTTAGTNRTYNIDDGLNQNWNALKAEAGIRTLGINASADLNGDGVPEVFTAHVALTHPGPPGADYSRLVVYDGATGAKLPGWEHSLPLDHGVTVLGKAERLGLGKVGTEARDGVFTNTGMTAGVTSGTTISFNVTDALDTGTDPGGALSLTVDPSFSAGVYHSGLKGFYETGVEAWNLTGGRFVDVEIADELKTGGAWTGILAGGGDGWVYGLNGSKAITPVTGFEGVGITGWNDSAMANGLEGYAVTADGYMSGTRDGWTTTKLYRHAVPGPPYNPFPYPGLRAVDTIDAPYLTSKPGPDGLPDPSIGGGNVSWWAGDTGLIVRSLDRLNSTEQMTTVGQLSAIQNIGAGGGAPVFPPLTNFDLTFVNFHDVLAVSAKEAWFVGGGNAGVYADDGFVVRTTDGGASLLVTRFTCKDALLDPIEKCHFKAIDHDGERLWAVGNNGMVLINEGGGMAEATALDLQPTDKLQASGQVALTLQASEDVTIRTVEVDWDPLLNLEWMEKVQVNTTDVWKVRATTPYHVDSGTYSPTHGAGLDAVVNATSYTTTHGPAGANTFKGDAVLQVGPFKKTLDPLSGYYTSANFPTATDLRITVTFSDGTQDLYVIDVDGSDSRETTGGLWREANNPLLDQPFTVPTCFGVPTDGCMPIYGINVTRHSETGELIGFAVGNGSATGAFARSSLIRLEPGTTTWTEWTSPVLSTLRDVSFNAANSSRVLAVGENDRVIQSFNGGLNWTDLPKIYDVAVGTAAPLTSVDYTHPAIGYVWGGAATGLQWTVDGYNEWGAAVTRDLHTASGTIHSLALDTSTFHISEGGSGTATVQIDVRDGTTWEPLHTANGDWTIKQLKDAPDGVRRYNYTNPTSDVELRFTLATPVDGFSRFSPMVRGHMELYKAGAGEPWASFNSFTTLDLNETGATLFTSTTGAVDHSTDPGYLRLKPAHNLWVHKLGNPDLPWWDSKRDTHGARVSSMALSPDGKIAYVGTEQVYAVGAAEGVAPGDTDTTLYAIYVENGTRVRNWTYPRFQNPILPGLYDPIIHVAVNDNAVFVVAQDTSAAAVAGGYSQPRLYRLNLSGEQKAVTPTNMFEPTDEVVDMVLAKTRIDRPPAPVLGIARSGPGQVYAFEPQNLLQHWASDPTVRGVYEFDYEVPRAAMFGGYIVETSIRWDITDSFAGGGSLLQTARIHSAFTVTPPNGRIPASPTYSLELIAWLEDWG